MMNGTLKDAFAETRQRFLSRVDEIAEKYCHVPLEEDDILNIDHLEIESDNGFIEAASKRAKSVWFSVRIPDFSEADNRETDGNDEETKGYSDDDDYITEEELSCSEEEGMDFTTKAGRRVRVEVVDVMMDLMDSALQSEKSHKKGITPPSYLKTKQAPEGKHAHRGPIDKSMKHSDAKRRRIALTTVPSLNIQTPPSTYYMSSETNTAMSHNVLSRKSYQMKRSHRGSGTHWDTLSHSPHELSSDSFQWTNKNTNPFSPEHLYSHQLGKCHSQSYSASHSEESPTCSDELSPVSYELDDDIGPGEKFEGAPPPIIPDMYISEAHRYSSVRDVKADRVQHSSYTDDQYREDLYEDSYTTENRNNPQYINEHRRHAQKVRQSDRGMTESHTQHRRNKTYNNTNVTSEEYDQDYEDRYSSYAHHANPEKKNHKNLSEIFAMQDPLQSSNAELSSHHDRYTHADQLSEYNESMSSPRSVNRISAESSRSGTNHNNQYSQNFPQGISYQRINNVLRGDHHLPVAGYNHESHKNNTYENNCSQNAVNSHRAVHRKRSQDRQERTRKADHIAQHIAQSDIDGYSHPFYDDYTLQPHDSQSGMDYDNRYHTPVTTYDGRRLPIAGFENYEVFSPKHRTASHDDLNRERWPRSQRKPIPEGRLGRAPHTDIPHTERLSWVDGERVRVVQLRDIHSLRSLSEGRRPTQTVYRSELHDSGVTDCNTQRSDGPEYGQTARSASVQMITRNVSALSAPGQRCHSTEKGRCRPLTSSPSTLSSAHDHSRRNRLEMSQIEKGGHESLYERYLNIQSRDKVRREFRRSVTSKSRSCSQSSSHLSDNEDSAPIQAEVKSTRSKERLPCKDNSDKSSVHSVKEFMLPEDPPYNDRKVSRSRTSSPLPSKGGVDRDGFKIPTDILNPAFRTPPKPLRKNRASPARMSVSTPTRKGEGPSGVDNGSPSVIISRAIKKLGLQSPGRSPGRGARCSLNDSRPAAAADSSMITSTADDDNIDSASVMQSSVVNPHFSRRYNSVFNPMHTAKMKLPITKSANSNRNNKH